MATAVARIATGRVVNPHITKRIGDDPQTSFDPAGGAAVLDVDEQHLKVVRQGMFEVVNTPAGTAYTARLTVPGIQMAGKTGTAQVHNDTAAESVRNYNDDSMPWAMRPNALFIAFAPVDQPRYAAAVVVEHGLWGGQSAAPIARDLMTYALTRNSDGNDMPIGTQISDEDAPG